MGRPRKRVLSRSLIADTALAIIDDRGLGALSLETLADELGVKAPSLYHHFRGKAAILAEVARRLLLETPRPPRHVDGEEWVEWFVELSLNTRATILRHRNAAPLLEQFLARDLLVDLYEDAAKLLEASGVPIEQHVLVLEGLETLTMGTAIRDAASVHPCASSGAFSDVDPVAHPTLARAVDTNVWAADEIFAHSIRRFLTGTTDVVPQPAGAR